ncbi:MAG: gamma-glutamylcyclotransferase [Proteobacteria bacterium]|nr:gamma-glutamylcyclotransferase [Pseudomonadota bacterium]
MLYFAYGSNLDDEDWRHFCIKHSLPADCIRPVGPAFLPDHDLVFDVFLQARGGGALNIKARLGGYVCGALFEVGDFGWRALDLKEGVSDRVYQRASKYILQPNGSPVLALTYEVTPESQCHFVEPTSAYFEVVQRGLRRFNFSDLQLSQAAVGERVPDSMVGVFAYGTLLSGESRHWIIESLNALKPKDASSRGSLLATEFDYPMLHLYGKDSDQDIPGELIFFPDLSAAIRQLDKVEGFSSFGSIGNEYDRALVTVMPTGEDPTLAWCYVAGDLGITTHAIEGGSWRECKKDRVD